tara:strand:- start:549 stop:1457 length:909 start_codon:yes stop_codon:yes gene_type:complete
MAYQYTPTLGNIVSSTGEKEEDSLVGAIPITNRIDPRAAAEEESEDEEELFYMNDIVDEISTMLSPPPPPPFSTPTTSAFSPIPGPPKLVRSSCVGRTYPAVVTPIISDDEQEDENNLFRKRYSPPTPPRQSIARELVFTSEDENEEAMTFPMSHVTFDMTNNDEDTDGSTYDEWDEATIPDTTTDALQLLNMQLVLYDENNNEIEHIDMDVHPQEEETEDDATWNGNSDEEDTDYDTEEDEETDEETEEETEEEEVNTNDEMNDDFSDTESETSWSDGDGEPWQYSLQIDRYEERNDRGWE